MKNLKTFEEFLYEGNEPFTEIKHHLKLKEFGRNIINANITKYGDFQLNTPTHIIQFSCAGGASIEVSGSNYNKIKNTKITSADIYLYEVTIEFSNGETIELTDGTGGEGIEITATKK